MYSNKNTLPAAPAAPVNNLPAAPAAPVNNLPAAPVAPVNNLPAAPVPTGQIIISRANILKKYPDFALVATLDQICEVLLDFYIQIHKIFPAIVVCVMELLALIKCEIEEINEDRPSGYKLKSPNDLPNFCIARLIAAKKDIALIASRNDSYMGRDADLSDEKKDKLPTAMYQNDGYNKGIWEIFSQKSALWKKLVRQYKPSATKKDLEEIYDLLRDYLDVKYKCTIPYYVPVNNVIVDVLNHRALRFDKSLVFTSKIHTNLNVSVQNPQFQEEGELWTFDDWINSLGSKELVLHIMEVIQAACLPLAPRDKMVIFYSETGNNGKGTICQLIRDLLGRDVTASIPLNEFSVKFGLSTLPDVIAIITDENDVCSFNKGLATLKAVITGDTVTIEKKCESKFDYEFRGLVLQCCNDLPNGNDKTGSFKRRLHIIPFSECFTGRQKKYIKEKLLRKKEVLEYVLKKVLMEMDYRNSFTETEMTINALKKYEKSTNSVISFLDEFLPRCMWDLLPGQDFLYAAYKEYQKRTNPSSSPIGRDIFYRNVKTYIASDPKLNCEWEWKDCERANGRINSSVKEPLLVEYNLTAFLDAPYSQRAYPDPCKIKEKYSGCLVRRTSVQNATASNTTQNTATPNTGQA